MKQLSYLLILVLLNITTVYSQEILPPRCPVGNPPLNLTSFPTSPVPGTTNNPLPDTIKIPVAFHVIYGNGNAGNIDSAKIIAQINTLNADYAGTYFTFELMSIDRTFNHNWYENVEFSHIVTPAGLEYKMKAHLMIDVPRVLNIYTVDSNDALGWAELAQFAGIVTDTLQGIVIRHDIVPGGGYTIGRYFFGHGKVLVHEAGHYLGLHHTYEGGCTGPGDKVGDTPPEHDDLSGRIFACTPFRDTCPVNPEEISSATL